MPNGSNVMTDSAPFANDAGVHAESTDHVSLALFDELNLLPEGSSICAFPEPSYDPLACESHKHSAAGIGDGSNGKDCEKRGSSLPNRQAKGYVLRYLGQYTLWTPSEQCLPDLWTRRSR